MGHAGAEEEFRGDKWEGSIRWFQVQGQQDRKFIQEF